MFNMLMSPTKWIIRQTDLADGLATVSEKTDVSTPPFIKPLCAFQHSTRHQNNNKCMYLCMERTENALSAGPVSPRSFFPRWCTATDERYIVTTQKTEHKRGFCMFELPESFLNTLFFQPDNDLFLSSTVSYLAYLSKLEGKIII